MKPSDYLFFPVKKGEWLRDSQGKPRVYKTISGAFRNLQHHDYDGIQVYEIRDVISKEKFKEAADTVNNLKKVYKED